MLQEAKLAMAITTTAFDAEIVDLLDAGARDLEIAGVRLPGRVSFSPGSNGILDNSTLTDRLVMRAIITYVRVHFGSPPDYERVKASYDEQKVQLMHATGYTDWGDCGC